MASLPLYQVISANSANDFQSVLQKTALGGWKPILLTSASTGDHISIVAILELPGGAGQGS
jgi:hypothetical protein